MSTKVVVLKAPPEALKSIKETPKKPRKRPVKRQATAETDEQPKPVVKAVPSAGAAVSRALDRSGAPCRRWTKSPLQIRSFTGVSFEVTTWQGAGDPQSAAGDANTKSDATPGSADIKKETGLPDLPTDAPSEIQSEPVSEPASELVSEPPSEAPMP